jgi:hypothetical protein
MSKRPIICAWCSKSSLKETGAINRAKSASAPLYCDRECAGLGRRKGKTKQQLVDEKSAYDAAYREKNRAMLKAKKAERFRATYDPEKARIERASRMPRHVEYCRRPEYKAWKKQYDLDYRAREYGPFSEAYKLLLQIETEIDERASWYEVAVAKGTLNKKRLSGFCG